MAQIQIDLKNYRSIMSDRVEPGRYKAMIEEIDATSKTRDGAPQMMVYARITEGPFKDSVMVERLPLDPTSKAMFRTVGFLTGMGVPTPRRKIAFDESRIVGRRVYIEIVDNEYNGRTTSQVDSWQRVVSKVNDEPVDELEESTEGIDEAPAPKATPKAAPVVEPEEDEEESAPETNDALGVDLDDIDL